MSAPKTIHVSASFAKKLHETESMKENDDIEYRLFDPNEKTRIDNVCEWSKINSHGWGSGDIKTSCGRGEHCDEDFQDTMKYKKFCPYCGGKIEIIDRITNEAD
jgi:hypothetical protein